MKIPITKFVEFAYGDKRKDRATVKKLLEEIKIEYDPMKDRYKQFREALQKYEDKKLVERDFLNLHTQMTANKSSGYKALCKN